MSLHPYYRDGVKPTMNPPPDWPIVIVGHGGGSAHWNKKHSVVQMALQIAPVVYSFQLPLHGEDALDQLPQPFETISEKQQFLRDVLIEPTFRLLQPVVEKRYVIMIGYSTSQSQRESEETQIRVLIESIDMPFR